jgi:hypothetical protein
MRSETVVLPNESPAEFAALRDDWVGHYQPQTPGMKALVDRALMATVYQQRSTRYVTAALTQQMQGAAIRYEQQQEDVVAHYVGLLQDSPAAAVRGLRSTAAGCRWVIAELLSLQAELLAKGVWVTSRRQDATRLFGHRPEEHKKDPLAFQLRYLNILSHGRPNEQTLAELRDRSCMPDTLHGLLAQDVPTPQESREQLRKLVADELTQVRAEEARLRAELEEPALAAAVDKMSMLSGDDLGKWLRYERMHDAMFHKAYNALERGEAAPANPDPTPTSTTPPTPAPEPPAEPASNPGPVYGSSLVEPTVTSVPTAEREAEGEGEVEGPVVTVEADGERRTKHFVTIEPVLPGGNAEASTSATPASASSIVGSTAGSEPSALAAEGPVVTVRADIERRTKHFVTMEPVLPGDNARADAAGATARSGSEPQPQTERVVPVLAKPSG